MRSLQEIIAASLSPMHIPAPPKRLDGFYQNYQTYFTSTDAAELMGGPRDTYGLPAGQCGSQAYNDGDYYGVGKNTYDADESDYTCDLGETYGDTACKTLSPCGPERQGGLRDNFAPHRFIARSVPRVE